MVSVFQVMFIVDDSDSVSVLAKASVGGIR
jgi:hypothetical protein